VPPEAAAPLLLLLGIAALATALSFRLWTRRLRGPLWRDEPRVERHHARATPTTGGVAWMTGFTLALGAAIAWPSDASDRGVLVLLLVGAAAAALLGRQDDLGRVGPARKQALQAALLLGAWLGLRRLLTIEGPEPAWPAALLGVGLALALQLALNIWDHLDGNLVTVAAAGFLVLATSAVASPLAVAAVVAAGASLGFLAWNRPPAAGFLSNQGSQPIAFVAALLVGWRLTDPGDRPMRGAAVLLPFAWPLLDLGFVVVRRLLERRAPWEGGRDHTTHLLARALGSDRAAWLCVLGCAFALAFVARNWLSP